MKTDLRRRGAAMVWVAVAVITGSSIGCTSRVLVPRGEYVPGRLLQKSRVFVKGGTQYEFERVSFRPDTLLGEYRVAVERRTPSGNPYYEKESRVFPLPLSEVDSIEVVRRDVGKTLLVGAGIAAGAAFIYTVANPDLPGSKSGDSGKGGSGGL